MGEPPAAAVAATRQAAADRLTLRGIRAHGHHGVFDHERRDGQEFVVDAVLGLDTSAAGLADDLSQTVDYGRLSLQIKEAIESDPVDLIETLARRLADLCLAEPLVQWVEVTVHKPQAPIEVPFDDVTLTIHRSSQ
ncbi:MAG: dihydroneopterin aldolase [Nocardioidaceae bacterium]